ncbi:MAG: uracil-DNA glycosylase, partial [Proteobacteria bacterium]|nr:uracil-DNA glycosylase [Pseudomonadota bacterium]
MGSELPDKRLELLSRIADEVRGCRACPLHEGTRNAVPGEGNPHAEVMLIGEAPGQNEDAQGRPFVGASGQFLTQMLAAAGYPRSEVFIANVAKHRPPGNRDPMPDEIAACSDFLQRQVDAINPLVIVTLGRLHLDDVRAELGGDLRRVGAHVHGLLALLAEACAARVSSE